MTNEIPRRLAMSEAEFEMWAAEQFMPKPWKHKCFTGTILPKMFGRSTFVCQVCHNDVTGSDLGDTWPDGLRRSEFFDCPRSPQLNISLAELAFAERDNIAPIAFASALEKVFPPTIQGPLGLIGLLGNSQPEHWLIACYIARGEK